jgi:hypothetical protein
MCKKKCPNCPTCAPVYSVETAPPHQAPAVAIIPPSAENNPENFGKIAPKDNERKN